MDEKSKEITAVQELRRLPAIKSCIVTVDALNTQKNIANEICEQGADYVLALKENHPTLHNEAIGIFEAVCKDDSSDGAVSITKSRETGYGRMETRRCWSIEAPEWLSGFAEWKNLTSLVMIEATREVKDQKTTENRYCLASLAPNAKIAAQAVRNHWGFELWIRRDSHNWPV